MPIFAMCENLLPAAFDDIGAAVLMPDPEVTTTTTEIRWPSRKFRNFFFPRRRRRCGVVIRVVRGGFLSISLSHVATLHFLLGVFPIFFSLSRGSVHSLFPVEHFSGGVFSNNQHFCVFYITFWNCFTDLVPLSSFLELVLYMYVYNRLVNFFRFSCRR